MLTYRDQRLPEASLPVRQNPVPAPKQVQGTDSRDTSKRRFAPTPCESTPRARTAAHDAHAAHTHNPITHDPQNMMSKLSRAFARHHAHSHNTQTIAGFDQHVQVGTTKWAMSLRNVNTVKNDPYGRPVMSVVVGHKEKQQARAVESMLNRVMARYPLDDPKVAETINAFREHVQEPSMDDLVQLNDVLAAYIRRKRKRQESKRGALTRILAASARKNVFESTPAVGIRDALDRGRAGSSVGGSQASASKRNRRPSGSAQSDSASGLYLDVRKDEWYAVRAKFV